MKKVLLVGAGGWARQCWVDEVFPVFLHRISVVGIVDTNEDVLNDSGAILKVPQDMRFTDMRKAFDNVKADFCVICIPPAYHKDAVLLAAEKGMHILSEKPVADTHGDVIDIYNAVNRSSIKMAVTQNYRFEAPVITFKEILKSGDLGRLDYIVARYASDYRKPGSWGVDHVHERDNPLMIEGAIHQFDMIRNLSGSDCDTIMGVGWNPEWSSFAGNPNGLFLMQMENSVKAVYEGSSLAAGTLNNWFHEYYRAECEHGAVKIDNDQMVRIYRRSKSGEHNVEEVRNVDISLSGHHAIMEDFLIWLDGGKPVVTLLKDNMKSAAMVFAAIDAFTNGEVKKVADYLP